MPGVRQGCQHPYSKSIQAEIVDVDCPVVIDKMSAQSLNLLKLNWTVAVECNSKPATQCLKLYSVRYKPHAFPLTKEYHALCLVTRPKGFPACSEKKIANEKNAINK